MAGMSSDKGSYLVIPTSGVYFVYSQVTYACLHGCLTHAYQFSASVSKKTRHYPEPETLMKGYTSPLAKMDTFLKISIYQAGAFKLSAGDRIYVEVPKTLIKNVTINEGETYFGAFLLEHSAVQ
ncbi:tumor necrosis factor ligand superfamily member 15-like [Leucoraja erinacea]|uniref:tumor necrosis factor ligand superfamily member 15-like n=1 Tax=Leucoraja erinaceus TaxID=7782 RepID=UPI002458FEB5|nr:tumor necrosis factor ligand superfamily member 15-like [Leucoraja erinacea]